MTSPDRGRDRADADARRVRREFIASHHPDRGGDPDVFIDGLRRLSAMATDATMPAVVVRQTAHPARTFARFLRRVERSLYAVRDDLRAR